MSYFRKRVLRKPKHRPERRFRETKLVHQHAELVPIALRRDGLAVELFGCYVLGSALDFDAVIDGREFITSSSTTTSTIHIITSSTTDARDIITSSITSIDRSCIPNKRNALVEIHEGDGFGPIFVFHHQHVFGLHVAVGYFYDYVKVMQRH